MDALLDTLKKVQGVSFASFLYHSKGKGEKVKALMILGASVTNLYRKDVAVLTRLVGLLGVNGAKPDTLKAAQELLASRLESLEKGIGNNSAYTQANTFTHLDHLPGVKFHNETGELYIGGLISRWDVVEAGPAQKPVKSSAKTLAKREIEKRFLASQRYVTLCLGNVSAARAMGDTLELESASA